MHCCWSEQIRQSPPPPPPPPPPLSSCCCCHCLLLLYFVLFKNVVLVQDNGKVSPAVVPPEAAQSSTLLSTQIRSGPWQDKYALAHLLADGSQKPALRWPAVRECIGRLLLAPGFEMQTRACLAIGAAFGKYAWPTDGRKPSEPMRDWEGVEKISHGRLVWLSFKNDLNMGGTYVPEFASHIHVMRCVSLCRTCNHPKTAIHKSVLELTHTTHQHRSLRKSGNCNG